MEIKLNKEIEKKLIASIKRYTSENLETEMGDLQSSLFLQFLLEEIGPFVYNLAISDAQAYMQEKALDLETAVMLLNSPTRPGSTKRTLCADPEKNSQNRSTSTRSERLIRKA